MEASAPHACSGGETPAILPAHMPTKSTTPSPPPPHEQPHESDDSAKQNTHPLIVLSGLRKASRAIDLSVRARMPCDAHTGTTTTTNTFTTTIPPPKRKAKPKIMAIATKRNPLSCWSERRGMRAHKQDGTPSPWRWQWSRQEKTLRIFFDSAPTWWGRPRVVMRHDTDHQHARQRKIGLAIYVRTTIQQKLRQTPQHCCRTTCNRISEYTPDPCGAMHTVTLTLCARKRTALPCTHHESAGRRGGGG